MPKYQKGLIFRPAGWRNPKGKKQSWGFSSPLTVHCTACHVNPYENG